MDQRHWSYALAAALAAGGIAGAQAIERPHQTSAGSRGDFTAADEAKSTMPVPPVPVASGARGESGADARLADKVVQALNADPSLEGSRIQVKAADGTVAVAGFVPSIGAGQKVERIASASAGAGKVTSSLRVAG